MTYYVKFTTCQCLDVLAYTVDRNEVQYMHAWTDSLPAGLYGQTRVSVIYPELHREGVWVCTLFLYMKFKTSTNCPSCWKSAVFEYVECLDFRGQHHHRHHTYAILFFLTAFWQLKAWSCTWTCCCCCCCYCGGWLSLRLHRSVIYSYKFLFSVYMTSWYIHLYINVYIYFSRLVSQI